MATPRSARPVYAQPITITAVTVTILMKYLARGAEPKPLEFFKEVSKVLDITWNITTASDLSYPGIEGHRTLKYRQVSAYISRLRNVAVHDGSLTGAYLGVAGLVDRPDALMKPDTVLRVLRRSSHNPDRVPVESTHLSPEVPMAKFTIIRYETRPDSAEENQQAVERVFAELAEKQPEGLRYATFRLDDGVTFIHMVVTEGDADPLPQLAAFQEFAKGSGDRMDGKPTRSGGTVVGSYNFLAQPHDFTD